MQVVHADNTHRLTGPCRCTTCRVMPATSYKLFILQSMNFANMLSYFTNQTTAIHGTERCCPHRSVYAIS